MTVAVTQSLDAYFEFLLRQGDTALILGQRLSEWCGHAPILEEDIALANTALDLIGQAQMWLGLAADTEGAGRSSDDLAFRREVYDFRNLLMVERPNDDFAHTMLRQFFFDAFQVAWLGALKDSGKSQVSEIAQKSVKEALYHLERSRETVVMLGDGTQESHQRLSAALTQLWPFAGEMFVDDPVDHQMAKQGIAVLPSDLRDGWLSTIGATLTEATLDVPDMSFAHSGGRTGTRHTEHLGHLLATMQYLPRAYPDATW